MGTRSTKVGQSTEYQHAPRIQRSSLYNLPNITKGKEELISSDKRGFWFMVPEDGPCRCDWRVFRAALVSTNRDKLKLNTSSSFVLIFPTCFRFAGKWLTMNALYLPT